MSLTLTAGCTGCTNWGESEANAECCVNLLAQIPLYFSSDWKSFSFHLQGLSPTPRPRALRRQFRPWMASRSAQRDSRCKSRNLKTSRNLTKQPESEDTVDIVDRILWKHLILSEHLKWMVYIYIWTSLTMIIKRNSIRKSSSEIQTFLSCTTKKHIEIFRL